MAVSNSSTQRLHIEAEAKRRGFKNLRVVTCDVNELTAERLGLVQAKGASAESKEVSPPLRWF